MAFTGSRNHFNEVKSILKSHGINWVGLSQIILGWKENNQLDACLESGFSVKECF